MHHAAHGILLIETHRHVRRRERGRSREGVHAGTRLGLAAQWREARALGLRLSCNEGRGRRAAALVAQPQPQRASLGFAC